MWHWVLLAATLMPMGGIMLAQLAAWSWYGELACHWTLHGAVALLPAMVVFRRDARWGRLFIVLLVLALLPWLQAAWASRATPDASPAVGISIATANVYLRNPRREEAFAAVAAGAPDLVALQEITAADQARWRDDPSWPHQVWTPRDDVFKIALLSRRRIVTSAIHGFDGGDVIEALVDLGEAPLRVFVVHAFAPVDVVLAGRRDRSLAMLARELQDHPEPVLVLGDFNLSPGSPMWRSFTGHTGLRRAPGHAPATWPSLFGPCGIAIDHILGRNVGIGDLRAFPISGSDHRGLRATVSVR
jgi:endonuclease/exonuclease/phosphatase (EEP) superfamily protein YafD